MSYVIPTVGALLCLFAMAQLGFWAAQSWSVGIQNQKQYQLARDLIQRQIEAASRRASGSGVNPTAGEATDRREPDVQPDGTWSGYRRLQVIQRVTEAEGITSIVLAPQDGLPLASFTPGQHLVIRLSHHPSTRPLVRCYSLSSGPGAATAGAPVYRLTVKAIAASSADVRQRTGLASHVINQDLQVGDWVEARQPTGRFLLDQQSEMPIVMLAGGIGVTPMISMVEATLRDQPQRLMVLLYGVRNSRDHAFKSWLTDTTRQHRNLMVVNCYSGPLPTDIQGVDYQFAGRMTIDLVRRLLPSNACQFYLCGPEHFMQDLCGGLGDWGVPDEALRYESFGPASRPSRSKLESESRSATVVFSRSQTVAPWSSTCESLLELAEQNQIQIESACRMGNCGTCATRLLQGHVRYPDGNPDHCAADECLTCIAIPDGDVQLDA